MGTASRQVLLLTVSLVGSALAGEVGLRLLGKFQPPPPVPIPMRPDLYQADPELGYTLKPSTRATYYYPIGSSHLVNLVSNSDGFRSPREFDGPDSRVRIWVLGDSLVLGDGVEAPNRLTEVMEGLEPGWRVENIGMTGWGVDLMVRAFEKISRRVRPDVVVLAFYTDDFRRVHKYYSGMGFPIRKFKLLNGRLETVPYPTRPWWEGFRLIQGVEKVTGWQTRNNYALHWALLDRLRAASDRGVKMAVAFLPGRSDTTEDKLRRAWLLDWCVLAGVPFIDLTTTIHGAGVQQVFIENNEHWNEKGHRIAGEAIRLLVRENVLK
jgi:hypothetical protein